MVITEAHFDARFGVPAEFAAGKAHSNIRRAAAGGKCNSLLYMQACKLTKELIFN